MIDFSSVIGVKFVNGGRTLEEGFDCWGLTMYAWKHFFNIDLPDYKISCEDASAINDQINYSTRKADFWKRIEQPQEPCLIVMRFNSEFCNHTGTYLGYGMFLHTSERIGVRQDSINHPYWKRHIEGFYVPNK